MFVIERKEVAGKRSEWKRVDGEYSTADFAKNIARMKFGKSNQSVRIVDPDAIKTIGGR
jgi:hypothetical protein